MADSGSHKYSTESNFKLTITCPICYNYFSNPKQFPQCPHTLCLQCLEKLPLKPLNNNDAERGVECPTCRVISNVGPNGVSVFSTNAVVQQIVEMAEAQEKLESVRMEAENASDRSNFGAFCPHVFLLTARHECPHCKQHFCNSCKFVHIERIKQEVAILQNTWTNRFRTEAGQLSSSLQAAYSDFQKQLTKDVFVSEQQIRSLTEKTKQNFHAILDERCSMLIEELKSMKNDKLSKLEVAVEVASGNTENGMTQRLDFFAKTSAVSMQLEEAATIHKNATDIEEELTCLTERGVKWTIAFEPDSSLVSNVNLIADVLNLGAVTSLKLQTIESPLVSTPEKATLQLNTHCSKPYELTVRGVFKAPHSAPTSIASVTGSNLLALGVHNSESIMLMEIPQTDAPDRISSFTSLRIVDPDNPKFFIINYGKIVSGEVYSIYFLENSRHRIFRAKLSKSNTSDWTASNVKVVAWSSGCSFKGLALNANRHELYTLHNCEILAFDSLCFSKKYFCKVLPNASWLIGVSDVCGLLYLTSLNSQSPDSKRLHFKPWKYTLPKQRTQFDSIEERGVNIDILLDTGKIYACDFDCLGNLFFIDNAGSSLAVYAIPNYDDGILERCCHFNSKQALKLTGKDAFKPAGVVSLKANEDPNNSARNVVVTFDTASNSLFFLEVISA